MSRLLVSFLTRRIHDTMVSVIVGETRIDKSIKKHSAEPAASKHIQQHFLVVVVVVVVVPVVVFLVKLTIAK